MGDLSQFEGGGLPPYPSGGFQTAAPAHGPQPAGFGQAQRPAPAKPAWQQQQAPAQQQGMNKLVLFGIIGGGVLVAAIILVVGLMSLGGDSAATTTTNTTTSPTPGVSMAPGTSGAPGVPGAPTPSATSSPVGPPTGIGQPATAGQPGGAPAGPTAPTGQLASANPTAAGATQTPGTAAASASGAAAQAAPAGALSLDVGAKKWYAQAPMGLRGAKIADEDDDMIFDQFSWMVDLLPHLGHEALYAKFRFDTPWRRDPNLQLCVEVIPQFLNPADDRRRWKGYPYHNVALTHYVGMAGIEDRRNVVAGELPRSDPRAGVFGYREVARPEEITDGLAQTIMILGSGELAGPWVQGGGATVRGAREPYFDDITGFGTRGMAPKGVITMFADGSVRHVSANIDPKIFRAMCTIHGADNVDLSVAEPAPAGIPIGSAEEPPEQPMQTAP
jgi:hypothetical protein